MPPSTTTPPDVVAAPALEAPPPTEGFEWTALDGPAIELDMAERWGVTLDVDDAARGRYEPPYDRYVMTTPHCAELCVTVARIEAPAPGLAAAQLIWDGETTSVSGEDAVILDEGASPEGTLRSIRRFTVRRGSPGVDGQTVHRIAEVTRIAVVVPRGTDRHLSCIGHLEHGAEAVADPAVGAVLAACLSLRSSSP